MSSATELLDSLVHRGADVAVRYGKLMITAPRGVLTETDRAELAARKPELIAILNPRPSDSPCDGVCEPEDRCGHCGRIIFWKGESGWRCLGCNPPADWAEVQETLVVNTDWEDTGPVGAVEAARSAAISTLNEIGARLFELDGVVVLGIPRVADTPEVRLAMECLHVKRSVYLEDAAVPVEYRE